MKNLLKSGWTRLGILLAIVAAPVVERLRENPELLTSKSGRATLGYTALTGAIAVLVARADSIRRKPAESAPAPLWEQWDAADDELGPRPAALPTEPEPGT